MTHIREWLASGTPKRHLGVLAVLCATIFPLARFVLPAKALYVIPLGYVLYYGACLIARGKNEQ